MRWADGVPSTRRLQLPVWNALYQVRDFSQYIFDISARDANGNPVVLQQLDKSTWQGRSVAQVDYDVAAQLPGPFGAQVSPDHAFLNFAEILMYAVDGRTVPAVVHFENVPQGWSIATILKPASGSSTFEADSYDKLVDAPAEIGRFRELSFDDGRTQYHIAIDASPGDYDAKAIEDSVRQIVKTEVDWMRDQPCSEYLFVYHFPRGSGGGGMEHACSAAIDVSADRLAADLGSLQGVTAHEFFHLWNVKRIRPQTLEPVDYTKEQYTRALWFSEGVTSTVEDYILLRAGMIGEKEYLRRLGSQINTLQNRSAHRTQSAEESSLETWFDKYPYYRRPERSISYYDKGEILGVMLDLAMREETHGAKTLRCLFLWMNDNYAKRGRFFADSEGIEQAVEVVTGKDFKDFFRDYVAGTEEIPYDRYLNTAGLQLSEDKVTVADAGFTAGHNFDGFPVVTEVTQGSEAERSGLELGDTITELGGKRTANPADVIASMKPGDVITAKVRSGPRGDERQVKFALGSREETVYSIVEVDRPTEAQLARRSEWLQGPTDVTTACTEACR